MVRHAAGRLYPLDHRYITVTSPPRRRYITVTSSLHDRHVTVTSSLHDRHLTVPWQVAYSREVVARRSKKPRDTKERGSKTRQSFVNIADFLATQVTVM